MRVFASLLAFSFALASPAQASPRRVASLNLCTDELLLMIAEPGQIASITHLGQSPQETPLWRMGRRYPRNDGSLLSVASRRPDLVLTMGGGGRDRLRIAARLGIATLDLPFAQNLADVERSIARIALALDRREAGAALLRQIHQLKASTPRTAIDTLWLGGGGQTVAANGLEAQWMRLAGLRQRTVLGDRVSLETLLGRPPAILLRSDYRQGKYSAAQRWLDHPIARRPRNSRSIVTDGRRWTCMGPLLVAETLRLRREIAR